MRYRHTVQRSENIVKDKGVAPYEFREEVAKALFDSDVLPPSEIKCDLLGIHISVGRGMEVKANQKAVVVYFLFCEWKNVKKVHGRPIHDLDETFSKNHVVSWQSAQIGGPLSHQYFDFRARVHRGEHCVGSEIFVKRTRISIDGTIFSKIYLYLLDNKKKNAEDRWRITRQFTRS